MNTDHIISTEDKHNLLTGRIFMYVNRFLGQQFKANDITLTREQWTILVVLWKQDGVSQQAIADETGRDKPSTTRLLDNLEKEGYILRKPDAKDKRLNLICLTPKGKAIEKKIMKVANGTLDTITQGLTTAQLLTVKEVFATIYHNIDAHK
ncbi:MarR family transcriptional regulator [Taibaiella sp. KBW10]|uniref:MarR family winged helix-turn-helix transcriptional regulator n=1 Tax=Taibaiella sp. KBW10 TaxID=2153357 RepID=UPI000F59AB36|nr:MarR family transcriptional regulator [Taibaiella sp. KBW10]RQO31421.1 MarR family transcriptional regulator [Taibaiella sp. KBW10]